ncbi:MAG: T9SS type A sorting domain-containing protein [Melioribacteraceae bacterium]|nr:T9SS type A sorting domain-containing protein [Melioribacteraceae bacterium]
MKKLFTAVLIIVFSTVLSAQTYYVAGDHQGWVNNSDLMYDDGTNGDENASDGIYSREMTVASTGYHGWKVTDGTWDITWPTANSWYYTTSADQAVLFTLNTNENTDGWYATQNVVNTNETKPTTLTAVGNWQSQISGGNWNNSDASTTMWDDGTNGDWAAGDGIYCYHTNSLVAGNYQIKSVYTGSWNGWGIDGRSEDAQNLEFATTSNDQDVYFYTDVNTGRITLVLDDPLPVELSTFSASVKENAIELNWSTATEINNYGFEVERSIDEGNSFTKIGFVEGVGNTVIPQDYKFVDSAPYFGAAEYRLKQIDFDGKFEYSNVIEIEFGSKPNEIELAQNYPNPFNPTTTINFTLLKETNVSLVVYNQLGELVENLIQGVKPAGKYSVNFNAIQLTSGIYFYKLKTEDFTQVRKMMLMK